MVHFAIPFELYTSYVYLRLLHKSKHHDSSFHITETKTFNLLILFAFRSSTDATQARL
jgi:hypothetical protein